MNERDIWHRTVFIVLAGLLVLNASFIGDLQATKKVVNENRQLIAQLEANYAGNADFRRLCK